MAASDVKKLRPAGEGRKVERDTDESYQILSAAERGDIDTLVSMSHRGIDVTTAASSYIGDSVLHAASEYGQLEILRAFLSTGMPVDVRNNNGSTPLHRAAANDVNCVKSLLEAGAKVNAKNDNGNTPLHYAASCEAVDILVAAGATVDVMNKLGDTPLADAVSDGYGDTVKTLLQHNSDPTKLSQRLQKWMKELLREEEKKTNDPQQGWSQPKATLHGGYNTSWRRMK